MGQVVGAEPVPLQSAGEGHLAELLKIAVALGSATELPVLLDRILSSARQITWCDSGSIYLLEEGRDPSPGQGDAGEPQSRLWFAAFQNDSLGPARSEDQAEASPASQSDVRLPVTPERLVGWCALFGDVLNIEDVYALDPGLPYHFDSSFDRALGYRAKSMLVVPMRNTQGVVVGVIQLINGKRRPGERLDLATLADQVRPFDGDDQSLIEGLAALAAVCVERTRLQQALQAQIDSMTELLAGAIDAKSPHTGLHCSRVPELALMLAEAAVATEEGPLAAFSLDGAEAWREFRTAAWLHDCGKVTTPGEVVEKATKLETSYNRIHEIRTRFEVLLRDARITMLEQRLAGVAADQASDQFERRRLQLQDDFAFIAACNIGTEKLAPEAVERLDALAGQIWQRHFDHSLGLGWLERSRLPESAEVLPVPEALLADQCWHRIPRSAADIPDPADGFTMAVPELLYNRGEVYNLKVSRGTLTPEEQYKIREHMVNTIRMLERIPFPPSLSRVAEIAGAHHETLDGKGYPRGLSAEQLSVPARILAIADIFEALTAADRPYKVGNKLSEAVAILAGFRDRHHIDPDLFELFLRSGVYRTYAERFVAPAQIDSVEIERHLRR